jgi:hypothetical protein
MSIYRGAGGAGDAVADSSSEALLIRDLAVEVQADADAAAGSATSASTSATNAATSATSASNSATAAATSATNASNSASAASTSATNAANSATAAQTAETAAELAETNAETAETNAANSASAASSSASAASTSATNASNSATAAATSATNASNSATAASTSASNAATSATNAANSATAAQTAETNAETAETNAETAQAAAEAAQLAAETAETNAETAETNAEAAQAAAEAAQLAAELAQTNAETAETNAETAASNAATSATNAGNSASAAATSETNAAASAAAAAASYDNFDDRYLGSKTAAPTLDNDGNALVVGALYYNDGTVTPADKGMYVYDGTQWIAASAASTAILTVFKYTATAGQTTFTGADDNALTLTYTAGSAIITVNGAVMEVGVDVTATTGTSIVLAQAALVGDEVNIYAFATFNIANTYTQAEVDAFAVKLTGNQTVAGVKTFSSPVTTSAGTVSAPAITTTGDTNTGIFFPAADTIAFTEGGVESMRIDASGNLGVGTVSPANTLNVVKDNTAFRGQLSLQTASASNVAQMTFYNQSTLSAQFYQDYSDNSLNITNTRASHTALWTNGFERMRIDSSGNVGIGQSAPNNKLQSSYTVPASAPSAGAGAHGLAVGSSGFGLAAGALSSGNSYIQSTRWDGSATNYDLILQPNGGNVGIGTSSPTDSQSFGRAVDTRGTNGAAYYAATSDNTTRSFLATFTGAGYTGTETNHPFLFRTNNTERMRITSGGDLLVGTNSGIGNIKVVIKGNDTLGLQGSTATNTGNIFFRNPSATNFWSISTVEANFYIADADFSNFAYLNQNPTSWLFASDARLKKNIQDLNYGIDTVMAMKPRSFDYINTNKHDIGFIAQELRDVVPEAVSGNELPFDDADTPQEKANKILGVGKETLIPVLVKAIQEQQELIKQLQADVAALKGTI